MLALILHLRFLDNKPIFKLCFSLCCSLYCIFKFSLFQNWNRCPECYGSELCRFFQNQQIRLSWFSLFLSLLNPNLTKSVFYGFFNDTEIVVKRIVSRTEEEASFNGVSVIAERIDNFVLCESVKDVKFLFDEVKDVELDSRSMEPLLLMYFQTLSKWPFPKYYGACGDLIVEEYKGEPLTNFMTSDFEKRISLANNLLEMAEIFTFGHPTLAFYFTDYSLDNLVVDSSGKVFLVDLDNLIISNKSATAGENSSLKRSVHRSEILDDYKYAFSPFDICQHYLSDHNYFSVCKYLLSHPDDGLLKNIPPEVKKRKEMLWLLNECSQPKVMSDRFSAGRNLQILFKQISNNFKW